MTYTHHSVSIQPFLPPEIQLSGVVFVFQGLQGKAGAKGSKGTVVSILPTQSLEPQSGGKIQGERFWLYLLLHQGDPGKMGETGPSGEPGIPVCIWVIWLPVVQERILWYFFNKTRVQILINSSFILIGLRPTFEKLKMATVQSLRSVYVLTLSSPTGWHWYPRREGDGWTQRSSCELSWLRVHNDAADCRDNDSLHSVLF